MILQIAAILLSTGQSSIESDVRTAIAHPSPATIAQLTADAAGIASAAEPHAKMFAIGLTIAVVMLRHPSRLPMCECQTSPTRHAGRNA